MNEQPNITCTINGRPEILPSGTTLLDFLGSKNIPPKAVVVELNKSVLPRWSYEEVVLSDGDTLEIVQIIGGG